jgi:2-amino-4-hydroxy-6-hydroxymethyldihydropteridine diphosphokinase
VNVQAFIGIGSNLGDRLGLCRRALDRLALLPDTSLARISPFFETEPQEGVEGGQFLNAVAEISTALSPRQLLAHLQGVEAALGRPLNHEPGTARTLDLDILLYGDLILEEPDLVIPHPRMAARQFVLAPLVAIAPATRHPVLNLTAGDLLRRLNPALRAVPSGAGR